MVFNKLFRFFVILGLALMLLFTVDAYSQSYAPAKPISTTINEKEFNKVTVYCPSVNSLRIKDQIWYKPNSDWKSYEPSFTTRLDKFVLAQWQGVVVGRVMICRYESSSGSDFPVYIQMSNFLVAEPKSANWKVTKTKSIKNCKPKANGIKDCPFEVLIPKKKEVDLYKSLRYYQDR